MANTDKSSNEDEEESEIKERAKQQYLIEKADKELVTIVSELAGSLKKRAQESQDTDETRKALSEIRMAYELIEQEQESARFIEEIPLEELFDELCGLIEAEEEERISQEAATAS